MSTCRTPGGHGPPFGSALPAGEGSRCRGRLRLAYAQVRRHLAAVVVVAVPARPVWRSASVCTIVGMAPDSDSCSMRERMLTGDLYVADDPELAEHNLRAMDLMDALNATSARDPQKRRRLLTELLGPSVSARRSGCRCGWTTAAISASVPGLSSTSVWWPWTSRRSLSVMMCRLGPMCS